MQQTAEKEDRDLANEPRELTRNDESCGLEGRPEESRDDLGMYRSLKREEEKDSVP